MLDLITCQGNDALIGLVEDVTQFSPEFSTIPTMSRSGTTYKVLKRTAFPPSQFRNANAGVTPGKSAYKQEVKEMFFLDAQIQVDEAIVKADDRSTGDILSHEAMGALQSAILTIGNQTWYGLDADVAGFKGVRSQLSANVAAGGTTNTNSAYLVWLNPGGLHYDIGKDGAISLPPPMKQQIVDPNASTKTLMAWVTNLSCFIGMSVTSAYSLYAVTGISPSTATTNKLTDALAANLVAKVPLVRRSGMHWFMNRSGSFQLQASRTAINYQPALAGSGAPAFAPAPTTLEGFSITLTDSILDTENNT
jgi:hypothetical protein